MSTTNPPQLFLLADHIKLSLLERQRAISLNLSPSSQDGQISRSLEQLRSGIEALESQIHDVSDESISSQLPRLRAQLADLTAQFTPSTSTSDPSTTTLTPNDPSLASDFAAATSKPARSTSASRAKSKSVRFRDDAAAADDDDPNRASLFPYRDDPSPTDGPNHDALSNQQIHEYHARVIDEQDAQLDQLGASIGRQRELSMQIGDELDGQVMLLDDVEEGVDRHAAQFRRARGRLDRFGRKAKENWSLSVIVVLIVVLVLLIVITK
ncbi:hypothetical protein DPSP01_010973 [Paraphaeosphaeria sporulosa]|uniref:t-SNARE coiled-coil homology domain-containing protein n=1 Tax=Paraphaeosphaeria sporulosa TaxID=1460663 RepID=A0A177D0Z1_9PLEO|nr:uncharacterized protein CC84DRAFT_1110259 [Paraphaeosphaeria sporulosa]OAG13156.1 hypothetical protein CC84DRAFT_1110259 [Paraphaeosphaeria sporulosa]